MNTPIGRERNAKKTLTPIIGRSQLRFLTEHDSIEALKRRDDLVEVPMLLVGDQTIIVPTEAVPSFVGLRFKEERKPTRRVA